MPTWEDSLLGNKEEGKAEGKAKRALYSVNEAPSFSAPATPANQDGVENGDALEGHHASTLVANLGGLASGE